MTENQQLNGTSRDAGLSVAMGFVLGAVVGAGIALLLAPGTGEETRRRVTDAGRRWRDAARDVVDDLKKEAKSALEAGREPLEHDPKTHETPLAPTTERRV